MLIILMSNALLLGKSNFRLVMIGHHASTTLVMQIDNITFTFSFTLNSQLSKGHNLVALSLNSSLLPT